MDVSLEQLLLLCLFAFLAGGLDAVVGGGGLVQLPALLVVLPGAPVVAKTGTAEFGDQEPLQLHAWMIAAQGDLAVAAFVEVGESGSRTAGPLLEQLLRAAQAR